MAASKSGMNISPGSGTEVAPLDIQTIVTDIADATFISSAATGNAKVITIKSGHRLDLTNYFVSVPSNVHLMLEELPILPVDGTGGLVLIGGCVMDIVKTGAEEYTYLFKGGTLKTVSINGLKPTIRQLASIRQDWPSVADTTPVAKLSGVKFKIDGLNFVARNEFHHKLYSTSPDSYIRKMSVMKTSDYTGAAPAPLQLNGGITIEDFETNSPVIAGEQVASVVASTAVNRIVRPTFYVSADTSIGGYFWDATRIHLVDMKFVGGNWTGNLLPTNGSPGSQVRVLTSATYKFLSGITPTQGIKVAFIPTKAGTHTSSQVVAAIYQSSSAAGAVAPQELLRREFFDITGSTAKTPNTTATWKIVARAYAYDAAYLLKADQEITTPIDETYQVTANATVSVTYAQAASIAGVAFDKAATKITLTAAVTLEQLHDRIRWWMVQDAQMSLGDFYSVAGSVLDIGGWTIDGVQYLTAGTKLKSMRASGNLTSEAAPAAMLDAAATIITTTGVNVARLSAITRIDGLPTTGNISTGGKLGFGSATTIATTGDIMISDTELAGSLTISTTVARKLTLKDCTGALTEIKVSGGGSLEVRMAGRTPSTIVPDSLGAGVTAGVVVTVSKAGGNFNVYAKRDDTGAGLGFSEGVATVTYVVPKGTGVTFAAWSLGYATLVKTIDTSAGGADYQMDMATNASIDTTLDVDAILADIDVTLAANDYSVVFKAAMDLDISQIKAVVHRIVGRQASLQASVAAGVSPLIEILTDEIKINQPIVFLRRAAALAAMSRVTLNGFINTTQAKAVSMDYVLNPSGTDGTYVGTLGVKPTVDYSLMAAQVATAVKDAGVPTRTQVQEDLALVESRIIQVG